MSAINTLIEGLKKFRSPHSPPKKIGRLGYVRHNQVVAHIQAGVPTHQWEVLGYRPGPEGAQRLSMRCVICLKTQVTDEYGKPVYR